MARSTSFGRDPGLQARMLLTLFLLGLVYAVLIGVLFAAGAGAVTIAVIAGALFLLQFFTSDKIALASMGAHEVTPQQAPELHAMIERLCIQADLPKPRIGVMESQMPNAFAMGRSKKAATVCAATRSHIANRDVAVMTAASFFASLASMIVQFGFFFGGGGDDDEDGPGILG